MQDFPPNSQRAKMRSEPRSERPEKIERVTSAEAERRKRGLGRKFKETFVGGSARGAFDYMMIDVVVPAIQNTLIDAVQGGFERLIKGDSPRPRRRMSEVVSSDPWRGNFDYRRASEPYRDSRPSAPRMLSRQARAQQTFDDIVISSRAEAEDVLDRMYDILSHDGMVRVSELYELTGIQSSHADYKWGWTQLRGAKVSRLRDGRYFLDLPEPEPLSS